MATDAQWHAALLEMSRAHHIKAEFGGSDYRLAVEIIRLREMLGETGCPVYAPARAASALVDDSIPF